MGEGPFWYHRDDLNNLPYIKYDGQFNTDVELDEDLVLVELDEVLVLVELDEVLEFVDDVLFVSSIWVNSFFGREAFASSKLLCHDSSPPFPNLQ